MLIIFILILAGLSAAAIYLTNKAQQTAYARDLELRKSSFKPWYIPCTIMLVAFVVAVFLSIAAIVYIIASLQQAATAYGPIGALTGLIFIVMLAIILAAACGGVIAISSIAWIIYSAVLLLLNRTYTPEGKRSNRFVESQDVVSTRKERGQL